MRTLLMCLALLVAAPAWGCPVCDSPVGLEVRAGLFSGSFLRTLLEVAAPFPLVGLVLYVVGRWLPD